MKTTIILLIGAAGILFGAPTERSKEYRQIEAEQVALWESKLAEAQTKPVDARPALLWLGLRNMGFRVHYHDGHGAAVDSIYLRIQQELKSIPNHARYFADEIKREQKEVASIPTITGPRVSYDRQRSLYFETFTHLPSPETIAVLGDFLSDDIDTPHPLMTPGSDWGENPRANSFFSSSSIMMIGLRNPPVAVARRNDDPEIRLAETRVWWERIGSGEFAFSFIGQTVEYRFKPDGTWETTALPESVLEQDLKPLSPPPVASGKPAVSNMVSTKPQWLWILGGATALLAVAAWLRLRGSAAIT